MKASAYIFQLAPKGGGIDYMPAGRRELLRLDAMEHEDRETPTSLPPRENWNAHRAKKLVCQFLQNRA
jgi:hypothetical protein